MRHRTVLLLLLLTLVAVGFLERDRLVPVFLPGSTTDAANSFAPSGERSGKAGGHEKGNGQGGHSVTVAKAEAGALPIQRTAVGTIVPLASTTLSSLVTGTVAKILVTDGAEVKEGDLLVQLDDRTVKANIQRDTAVLAKDQAALDEANITLKRVQALATAGADTQQQFDDAAAAVNEAQAAIAVDEANLAADRVALTQTQIRAPFDGKLSVVQQSLGAVVAPSTPIVTITQMEPVYAEFVLPETDLDLVRGSLAAGTLAVRISTTLAKADGPAISGPIVFIDNAVDAASGTFKLRALLDNGEGALWPGQALDITVQAGEQGDLALIPAVAVQPQGDGSVCFVISENKTVTVRKVEVALMAGDRAGISNGLKAGEEVVTEGQAGLVDGAHVSIVSNQTAVQTSNAGDPGKPSTAAGVAP